MLIGPVKLAAQGRGAPSRKATPPPPANRPQGPLTLAEVVKSLSSSGSKSTENAIKQRKVTFRADPLTVGILKEFGATDSILKLIPPALKLIPPVPSPSVRVPPAPKYSGPITIKCEPVDCLVVINNRFYGPTQQKRKTVTEVPPGEATVQVFSEGYEAKVQKVDLVEAKPVELPIVLELREDVHLRMAKDSLFEIIRAIGGIDGVSSLGEFEGEGTMDWTDSTGQLQHWPMTFRKRSGRELSLVFKPRGGQCSVSILGETQDRECKGKLKNSGEGVSEQAATLFLSYQVQDVLSYLLMRVSGLSAVDDGLRLEISGSNDSYTLDLGSDRLPNELSYSRTDNPEGAVKVMYSDYTYVGKAHYPARMQIAPVNGKSEFVFAIKKIRSLSNNL
jgi:hypothetical protein